jgi:hypothetical protein
MPIRLKTVMLENKMLWAENILFSTSEIIFYIKNTKIENLILHLF